MIVFSYIARFLKKFDAKEKEVFAAVRTITGFKPLNVSLYLLAMRHTSVAPEHESGFKESNERLEYLGDAILSAVVADFLFKHYPYQNEGFLTEIRSRIVSRESLNQIARKMGLDQLVQYDTTKRGAYSHKSLHGDAMEAFIGAIYLDKGYKCCQSFIIKKILLTHINLEEVIQNNRNYKSQLIEWAQKNNHSIKFEIIEGKEENKRNQFRSQVLLDESPLSKGSGFTKKKAEQDAARKACLELEILSEGK